MKKYFVFLCAIGVVGLSACRSDQASQQQLTDRAEFDYPEMMANYADNIIVPSYKDMFSAVEALAITVDNYCMVIGSAAEVSSLEATKQKWLDVNAVWQKAELTWVGPLLENDLSQRNRIYSYASGTPFDACASDLAVIAKNTNPDYDISTRSASVRGLTALEYLIYESTLKSSCSAVPQAASWNNLPEIDRKVQRCIMSQDLVSDLAIQVSSLLGAWDTSARNYRSVFIDRDNAGDFLSQLSDALFYVEKEIKDFKLGESLGLAGNCRNEECPEQTEARYANASAISIKHNLVAFKKMLTGLDGLGFDDIIARKGQDKFTQSLIKNIDAAIAMSEVLEGQSLYVVARQQFQANTFDECESISETMARSNTDILEASYCALHGLVDRITIQLKDEFVTIVNVDLPRRSQSDAD